MKSTSKLSYLKEQTLKVNWNSLSSVGMVIINLLWFIIYLLLADKDLIADDEENYYDFWMEIK